MLTDVRFKLLALVPTVSGLGLALTVGDSALFRDVWQVRLGAAAFGLAVNVGLFVYDKRNNELYNDLVSRGRRVEQELGMDTGVFRGRPEPVRGIVSHGWATGLVYWPVLVAWAAACIYVLLAR